jgi:hypothetical protein
LIFVRETSDPLTSLVKQIDQTVYGASGKLKDGQRKLGAFVIIGNAEGRADQLRKIAEKEELKRISLCIGDVPQRYEVNPEADVTVVIYNPGRPGQQAVTANFALGKGELDEKTRDAIVAELAKVLPK